jgi:hypothetical protein
VKGEGAAVAAPTNGAKSAASANGASGAGSAAAPRTDRAPASGVRDSSGGLAASGAPALESNTSHPGAAATLGSPPAGLPVATADASRPAAAPAAPAPGAGRGRNDRRPVGLEREPAGEAQAGLSASGSEARTAHAPARGNSAGATPSGLPGVPELQTAAPAAGSPLADVTHVPAGDRPRLHRMHDKVAPLDDEHATDERRPVRAASPDLSTSMLLAQMAAPAAPPPVDLVNARLQVMAREGRRGLESLASGVAGVTGADGSTSGSEGSKQARAERELGIQGPAVALPQDAPLPASLAGAPPPAVDGPSAPPLPPGAAPLLDQAAMDPGLNVSVMSRAAHMTITNDDGRALELHLRLTPEGADIRASGNLAPMVQARVAELGMALASQGLTLGSFQMGRDGSGRGFRDADEDREPARGDDGSDTRRPGRASSATDAGAVRNVAGRVHVKI